MPMILTRFHTLTVHCFALRTLPSPRNGGVEDALFVGEADVSSEASLSQVVVVHFVVVIVTVQDAVRLLLSRV